MLDCENRLAASEYFLRTALTESAAGKFSEFVWSIQASVLFVSSALEILNDYGEIAGLASKNERLEPKDFRERAKNAGNTF